MVIRFRHSSFTTSLPLCYSEGNRGQEDERARSCQNWKKWHFSLCHHILWCSPGSPLAVSRAHPSKSTYNFHWGKSPDSGVIFRWERRMKYQQRDDNKGILGSSSVPCKHTNHAGIHLTFCFHTCKDSPTGNLRFDKAQGTILILYKLYLENLKVWFMNRRKIKFSR